MKPFKFCPDCGARLPAPDEEHKTRCTSCGARWYRNAAPTAGCVIVRDGKALVTMRAFEPEKGRLDIPGGFLQHDEDPVSAVRREVREELGLDVEVTDEDFVQAVPHAYGDDGEWTLAMGFIARAPLGVPQPGDDVAEVRWVGLDELDRLDFAWEHDRVLVRKALEHGRS